MLAKTDVPKLYSRRAAAEFLGVQEQTLSAWACRGEGPAFHKVGRLVRYTVADLLAFLDARRVTPGAATPAA